ncbi:hypothetical protein BDQ12DRAFT_735948 [Crucibulum laeve]|uniref:Uncharacterized protein n=1 Tax=Crucibulum laeve TaxID=68775 RepID=A0A5C3LZP2_9AGAR|nr:hypothetical protein BDQ12DRAFT_735948 [Crucibulum laeve]
MPPKGENEPKRVPRRLFSFDALKTSTNRRSASEPNDHEASKHGHSRLENMTLPHVQEAQYKGGNNAAFQNWTGRMVDSPPPMLRTNSPGLDQGRTPSRQESRKPIFPMNTAPSRPRTPDSLPSPTEARWSRLRQHVLPVAARPETPPIPPLPPSASSTTTSFSHPTTPKPSRLARLGFRQVVDHAREVDDTRKFGEEILRACWSARSIETPAAVSKPKSEREATMASSLHLPFMSTTSLAGSNASTVHATGASKKHELRRPQSSQSLAAAAFRPSPSLKFLYQTIYHNSGADGPVLFPNLPHETQILSAFLYPFLTLQDAVKIEEEQYYAVQTFELMAKTWPPIDEATAVERCLWCCKAASVLSSVRARVIACLWRLLVPGEQFRSTSSPQALMSIASGLFTLLATLSQTSGSNAEDISVVKDVISEFFSGSFGELEERSVEEDYGTAMKTHEQDSARRAVVLQALMTCLENCSERTRIWMLHNLVEEYWTPSHTHTSLLSAINSRKLANFCRASLLILLANTLDSSTKTVIAHQIRKILDTKAIPEAENIRGKFALEVRRQIVRVGLELLCLESAMDMMRSATNLVSRWYNDDPEWKAAVEKTLHHTITSSDWVTVLRILSSLLKCLPAEVRRPMFTFILPILNDQLVEDPPPYPCPQLSSLLETLSHLYPPLFYKPLFSCAASSKEFTVVNHLCTLAVHSKFVSDYWTRDAEMMSVALMSETGGEKAAFKTSFGGPPWGKARLGQSILLIELISHIQKIRHAKEEVTLGQESALADTMKFVMALESRIAILLEVKERTSLIPPSQRMLFCILFREFRLLTRSLKSTSWLPKVVLWFTDFHSEDDLNGDLEAEVTDIVKQIQGLYTAARDGVMQTQQRRSTMLLPSQSIEGSIKSTSNKGWNLATSFSEHEQLLKSLSKGFPPRAMKLLVTVSTLLSTDDYRRLGPVLWQHSLEDSDASAIASACFLVMQCAEKSSLDLLAIIEVDLQTSDDTTRLDAVRKLSTLINWRFQILSQNVIVDRTHRSFKVARGPLPFVATDMGSTLYIHEEDPTEAKDNVPAELKKRLAEIGWTEDDTPLDQRQEWIRTPMSLLPANQMDRLDPMILDSSITSPLSATAPSPRRSPSPSPTPGGKMDEAGLLRRNSSSGGPSHGVKRKAIFVPPLASIFPRLASLIFDENISVAFAARSTLLDLMRNDPSLLIRPILDLFSGDHKDISYAISTFSALLHIRKVMPPAMSHAIFNNLAGFLKFAARQVDIPETLQDFALTVPILAKLVTQVSGMSIREIRRAKIEHFVIPSGSLWFGSTAPNGPMFPRNIGNDHNPFEGVPARLVSITMIRVSQNMLFLSMLQKNHQDVQLIRKNMAHLILPSREGQTYTRSLELGDFIPCKLFPSKARTDPSDEHTEVLSLMLSRSYLLLIAQVFRSMSRHLSDRNELAVLIDGLNRILLAHGDDISIVSQALIALMVASTRFRRLFTSGGGYALFMPAIMKVYTERYFHTGIKLAIEYAINRFYALHREAFLFQSLDAIARLFMLPNIEADWCAKAVYNLFFSLNNGITPSTPDAAGIHNINKLQEREALIVSTAEDTPQTFLAAMRRTDSQTGAPLSIELPEEYESRRLRMADFVRLFLTVIAHDPTIIRAEHFLRLFRFLTPYLYNASASARPVLQDGIGALCTVLAKASTKSKATDGPEKSKEDTAFLSSNVGLDGLDKSKGTSDILSMRQDYLSLVLSFGRAGGLLSLPISREVIELAKTMLKDSVAEISEPLSMFFDDFVRTLLLRDERPSVKAVVAFLRELSPIIHAYMTALDFTGVFETIFRLSAIPMYANDPAFGQVVVTEICPAALAACELAASENHLSSLSCRPAVVSLLAEAVLLRDVDVVMELEKRSASYAFQAGIVLPLVLTLRTEAQLVSDTTRSQPWHRMSLARAWVRLLFYAITACRKSLQATERSKSQEKRRSVQSIRESQLPTFITALQVIKVIIIRADVDISTHLPGIWDRLAAFFRSILAEGNANFALRPDYSPSPSPMGTPRSSGQFDESRQSFDLRRSHSWHDQILSRPRAVDYALWSVLEFICTYRNPLRLQLRLFMTEKIVALDQELRSKNAINSPFQLPNPNRRISTSAFAKPRGRMSVANSPDSSPRVSTVQPAFIDTSVPSLLDVRRAGYQISPSTPQKTNPYLGPKIVHLGPISPSAFHNPPLSPGGSGGSMRMEVNSVKIKSLSLIQSTYRRIRSVQSFMGYDLLLPIPQTNRQHDDPPLPSWTKYQALDAIVDETKQLMEEFEQSLSVFDDDAVFVQSEQPTVY